MASPYIEHDALASQLAHTMRDLETSELVSRLCQATAPVQARSMALTAAATNTAICYELARREAFSAACSKHLSDLREHHAPLEA